MTKWIQRRATILAVTLSFLIVPSRAAEVSAEIAVTGMTCSSCAQTVERALLRLDGVTAVKANWREGKVHVTYDDAKVTMKQIHTAIREAGFDVAGEDARRGCTHDRCWNGTREDRNGNRPRSRCCL